MDSLPERIEAAEGPSRELDAEIAELVGFPRNEDEEWSPYWEPPEGPFSIIVWRKKVRGRGYECPHFTASIDAAMTLVPDNARMFDLCKSAMGLDMGGKNWKAVVGHHRNRSAARTPALALCAAALRAKE